MEKGYLHSVVIIILGTLLSLLCLGWLPDISVGDSQLRKVDILSDLRPEGDSISTGQDIDSVASTLVAQRNPSYINECKDGMTCIVDMSDSLNQGIEPLYKALSQVKTLDRPVRIAVLGDSYIEGDILTADLRSLLQQHYGGCGVGFAHMSSDVAGFRRSVRQSSYGWHSHDANNPESGYHNTYANITGHYFNGGAGAMTLLQGVSDYLPRLDSCDNSSLYFTGSGNATVTARVNGEAEKKFNIHPCSEVDKVTVNARMGQVRWSIDRTDGGVVFLGASMDCHHGVVVDNFALRSASGYQLGIATDEMLMKFDQARHYDLVIIMYGLNISSSYSSDYKKYREYMEKTIERMKAAMPTTGFMVVSVGDRAQRRSGGLRTMPGIINLVNAQQLMAFNSGVSFWNLFTAMGGEGSIVDMVNAKPALANKDYTHINFRGGARLGALLYDAIVWGETNYTKYNNQ